jgi:acyl dehydratase
MKVGDLVTVERRELGCSSWHTVTQQRIDDFTGAVGASPTIQPAPPPVADGHRTASTAPGYLILSLVPQMIEEVLQLEDRHRGVNYGVNHLRFRGVVAPGTRVRGRTALVRGDRRSDGGVLMTLDVVVERDGGTDHALVAELLALAYD